LKFISGAQGNIERIKTNTELINQLRQAYEKLPNRRQKAIYLKFYQELITEQIAEQTGLCKRTVYKAFNYFVVK
jgi:DNA-directed RNA polymerase specialized sigma24 family protein